MTMPALFPGNPMLAKGGMLGRMMGQRTNNPQAVLNREAGVEKGMGAGYGAQAAGSRNRYMDALGGGQDALNESISSAMSGAMPQLQGALQGAREGAIRRGVDTGGLGTSYEGDVFSAFQRNIANAAGQQALGLYGTQLGAYGDLYNTDVGLEQSSRNRYLDILAGNRDADISKENAKNASKGHGLLGLGIGPL